MPEVNPTTTRRERLHRNTRAELSGAARDLLVEGGTEAVTVRAVAAALGMTAPAVYRYFASREAILEQVIADLYAELAEHLRTVRDDPVNTDTGQRLVRTARAFRTWAMEHRSEFGLLFGAPILGVVVQKDSEEHAQGRSFGQVWFELFVEIDQRGPQLDWTGAECLGPETERELEALATALGVPVRPSAMYLYLFSWQSLYGAVCTEVFGHLKWAIDDAGDLFESRLAELAVMLGFETADIPAD